MPANTHPCITVIITTYNRAHFITRAIESVLTQTFQDFELIVVDDASTDTTRDIVSAIGSEKLIYIRHERNRGGPAARNTGIRAARGRYIALLDDDDRWKPVKLEREFSALRDTPQTVGLVFSGSEIRWEKDGSLFCRTHARCPAETYRPLLRGPLIGSVSFTLIKRACFEKVGLFDESLPSCQDWDMWKRIGDAFQFIAIPDILTVIAMHHTQISTNIEALIVGKTRIFNKYQSEIRAYPDIYCEHALTIGKLHAMNRTWPAAWSFFHKGAQKNPFTWIKLIGWIVLRLPRIRKESRFVAPKNRS